MMLKRAQSFQLIENFRYHLRTIYPGMKSRRYVLCSAIILAFLIVNTGATMLGNKGVAQASILQGTQILGLESTAFGSRYFADPSFGALTQVVTTFPTGPTSGPCPRCKVPASLTFVPVSEPGTVLASFARSTGGNRANVFNVTNTDIPGSPSGVLSFIETAGGTTSIPLTGIVVQTTSSPPPGQPFFNVLFPISFK